MALQLAEAADEERDEVERRAVGPVEVLDDEHRRTLGREPAQHPEEQLEEAALGRADAQRVRRSTDLPEASGPDRGRGGRARTDRAPTTRATWSSAVTRIHERSASTMGANGRPPSPRSMQPPARTRHPCSRARSANSATRRVFPTPASPAARTIALCPSRVRWSAPANRPSSSDRPIRVGLETRMAAF